MLRHPVFGKKRREAFDEIIFLVWDDEDGEDRMLVEKSEEDEGRNGLRFGFGSPPRKKQSRVMSPQSLAMQVAFAQAFPDASFPQSRVGRTGLGGRGSASAAVWVAEDEGDTREGGEGEEGTGEMEVVVPENGTGAQNRDGEDKMQPEAANGAEIKVDDKVKDNTRRRKETKKERKREQGRRLAALMAERKRERREKKKGEGRGEK
ncbi:hypothetical protein ACMFMG_005868 [Clarireedia jacksonii]